VYVIPASPPCACIEAALRLKGVAYDVTELPNVLHIPHQLVRFGRPTVPAMTVGRERIVGSRAIVRRVDTFKPDPPLYAGPEVEEVERWADEELQPVGRRLVWWALAHDHDAMPSYLEGSRLRPQLPPRAARAFAPLLTPLGARRNGARDRETEADLRALPHHLSRIDGWLDRGVLGGETPNAADLQVASVLRLLLTIEDVAAVIERHGRAADLARRLFPTWPGRVPAGVVPAGWLG
jgi:glutathione S-transferase